MSVKTSRWLIALLLLVAAPVVAQSDGGIRDYRFNARKVPVGQVFHYLKSQRDGAHPTRVSVYVASLERIESLKWDRGGEEATLVVAEMDWSRLSVRSFEAWGLARGAPPELRATMNVAGDQLRASFMEQPLTLRHWPWHSYDFDFTSLTLTLPQRLDPKQELRVWRTDFVYSDPPVMAELGELTLRYVGREKRQGVSVWRYTLSGEGLQGKSGDWWVDPKTGLTLEYQLPVGDEPGYDDVWLRLDSKETITPAQWVAFKTAATAED